MAGLPYVGPDPTQPNELVTLGRATSLIAANANPDWVSVKNYGAIGNGIADDTAAVAAAVAAAAGRPVYFPTGEYKVTAWPAIVDNATFVGSSPRNSTIVYGGTGTLISAVTKQNVHFTNLGFFATGTTSKLFDLSNCFVWTFTACLFRGNHTSATGATYRGQYGITLRDNTGGCRFVDCDINNLGYGVRVSCIQNHFTMCKFVSNWYGILGTGNNSAAGLNITMTEFDAPKDGTTTAAHIWIDGMANEWNITQTWFEGGNKSLIVGLSGTGGPSKFFMSGCKMAAQTVALELNHCRQPHLVNTEFDADQNSIAEYKELLIDSTHCVEGVADNLITTVRDDFSFDDFPPYWNVIRKGQQRAGDFKANGVEVAGATRTGDFYMEYNAADGKIMATDADGKAYWRTPTELGLGEGGDSVTVIQETIGDHVALHEPTVYQGVNLTVGTTAPGWIASYITAAANQGSKFRVVGPPLKPDTMDPPNYWAMWNGADTAASVVPHEQSFFLKGPRISGMFMSYGPTDLQFMVEGKVVKPSFTIMPNTGGYQFVTLEFTDDTDPNKVRNIRGFFGQLGLLQWLLPADGAMYADMTERLTFGVAAADSFYHGAGGTTEGSISAGALGQVMSIMTGGATETISAGAQGGTGYQNAATGTVATPGPNGQTRFGAANRVAAFQAWAAKVDVILVGGGANDADFATYPLAATVDAAKAAWTAYGNAAPTKPLIVVGVQAGVYPSNTSQLDQLNAALKAAALAHPRVTAYLDDRLHFAMSGTGKVDQLLGDNADVLRSSDGVHYSRFGNVVLTRHRIAMMAGIPLRVGKADSVGLGEEQVQALITAAIQVAGSSKIEVVTTLPTTGTPGTLYVTTVT